MKKFLFFLVLIMTLLLSLFACSGGGDDEEPAPEPEVQADLDSDGKVGNTSISYADAKALAGENIDKGTAHPGSRVNLSIVLPPEYIKIF